MASNKVGGQGGQPRADSATWRAVNACPTSLRILVCWGGSSKMSGELANTGLPCDDRSDRERARVAQGRPHIVVVEKGPPVGPT